MIGIDSNPTREESVVNFADMSHEEIHRHVAVLDQRRSQALKALEQIQQQGKYDLAETIRDMIAEQGFSLEEILPLLHGGKRRIAGGGTRRPVPPPEIFPPGDYYVDPDNAANRYSRGAIPSWMKQKMEGRGLDPTSRRDRNVFRTKYLRRVKA